MSDRIFGLADRMKKEVKLAKEGGKYLVEFSDTIVGIINNNEDREFIFAVANAMNCEPSSNWSSEFKSKRNAWKNGAYSDSKPVKAKVSDEAEAKMNEMCSRRGIKKNIPWDLFKVILKDEMTSLARDHMLKETEANRFMGSKLFWGSLGDKEDFSVAVELATEVIQASTNFFSAAFKMMEEAQLDVMQVLRTCESIKGIKGGSNALSEFLMSAPPATLEKMKAMYADTEGMLYKNNRSSFCIGISEIWQIPAARKTGSLPNALLKVVGPHIKTLVAIGGGDASLAKAVYRPNKMGRPKMASWLDAYWKGLRLMRIMVRGVKFALGEGKSRVMSDAGIGMLIESEAGWTIPQVSDEISVKTKEALSSMSFGKKTNVNPGFGNTF